MNKLTVMGSRISTFGEQLIKPSFINSHQPVALLELFQSNERMFVTHIGEFGLHVCKILVPGNRSEWTVAHECLVPSEGVAFEMNTQEVDPVFRGSTVHFKELPTAISPSPEVGTIELGKFHLTLFGRNEV